MPVFAGNHEMANGIFDYRFCNSMLPRNELHGVGQTRRVDWLLINTFSGSLFAQMHRLAQWLSSIIAI